jgi:hypothetical protein
LPGPVLNSSPKKFKPAPPKPIEYEMPYVVLAVKPDQPTLIKIGNPTINKHENHPINKLLKLINQFCNITLVKATSFKPGL